MRYSFNTYTYLTKETVQLAMIGWIGITTVECDGSSSRILIFC